MFLSGYKGTWNYSNLNGSQFGFFLKGCVFGTKHKISYFKFIIFIVKTVREMMFGEMILHISIL